nr:hypothetical protein DBT41_10200 [Aerococcus urinae]
MRATATECFYSGDRLGGGVFAASREARFNYRSRYRIEMPPDTFPRPTQSEAAKAGVAKVPIIPVHLRPRHALANYHILWEADWHEVPYDPYLLRRIGKGDMWLVVAMWDLTEVERSALSARI